ncbi:MAG: phage integrase SAM-like domain-containing protein, partial [Alicyclobacillus macrosporangiidus]|nr:phage integrase SAM-like domain-containing protein [Alicyclobacillus macrosporangiidus]
MDEFIKAKTAERSSPRTIRDYKTHFAYLKRWLQQRYGRITISEITPAILREYIAWMSNEKEKYDDHPRRMKRSLVGMSPVTVNVRIRTLKAFFNWCEREGYVKKSPAADIRLQRVDDEREPVDPAKPAGGIQHPGRQIQPPEGVQVVVVLDLLRSLVERGQDHRVDDVEADHAIEEHGSAVDDDVDPLLPEARELVVGDGRADHDLAPELLRGVLLDLAPRADDEVRPRHRPADGGAAPREARRPAIRQAARQAGPASRHRHGRVGLERPQRPQHERQAVERCRIGKAKVPRELAQHGRHAVVQQARQEKDPGVREIAALRLLHVPHGPVVEERAQAGARGRPHA